MNDPLIPVGWGEVLDRISILEIKRHRLNPAAVVNVERELAVLGAVAIPEHPGLPELLTALAAVNQRLWTIEDRIREHDARGDFGPASSPSRGQFIARTTNAAGSSARSIC